CSSSAKPPSRSTFDTYLRNSAPRPELKRRRGYSAIRLWHSRARDAGFRHVSQTCVRLLENQRTHHGNKLLAPWREPRQKHRPPRSRTASRTPERYATKRSRLASRLDTDGPRSSHCKRPRLR